MKAAGFLGVTGLIVGVLGVLGPIGWDLYKSTSALEVKVVDHVVLISNQNRPDGISIQYKGEPLNQLSKFTLAIENTGRTPILEKDAVQPLLIAFTPESGVIEAKIESTIPSDLNATVDFSRSNTSIKVLTPLLNPGDRLVVAVLAKSANFDFTATARIAGLKSVAIKKDIPTQTGKSGIQWILIFIGSFSLLLLATSIFGLIISWPSENATKLAIKNKTFEVPIFENKSQTIQWMNSKFSFATKQERDKHLAEIFQLPESANFSVVNEATIMQSIINLLNGMTSNLAVAIFILLVAMAGLAYVGLQVFQ